LPYTREPYLVYETFITKQPETFITKNQMNVSEFLVGLVGYTAGMTACKDTEIDTGLWDSLGQRWQGSRSPFFFRGSGNQLEVVRGGLSRFLKGTVN